MKKTMRTLMCLMLVALMVACIAAPVMATDQAYTDYSSTWESKNGHRYNYYCYLAGTYSSGTARLEYGGIDNLSCSITATIIEKLNGLKGTVQEYAAGTSGIQAQVGNVFTYNGLKYSGEVDKLSCNYFIRNSSVVTLNLT